MEQFGTVLPGSRVFRRFRGRSTPNGKRQIHKCSLSRKLHYSLHESHAAQFFSAGTVGILTDIVNGVGRKSRRKRVRKVSYQNPASIFVCSPEGFGRLLNDPVTGSFVLDTSTSSCSSNRNKGRATPLCPLLSYGRLQSSIVHLTTFSNKNWMLESDIMSPQLIRDVLRERRLPLQPIELLDER